MQFPDKFILKSGRSKNTRIPLPHHVKTTSDFFKFKPSLCREVVPGDDFDVEMKSFVRMTPMPRPTFGRIKFHNRAFFVPYRTIMEGFTHFIEDINYPTADGLVRIGSVPYFTNADVADVLLTLSSEIGDDYYWRGDDALIQVLVTVTGDIAEFRDFSSNKVIIFRSLSSGDIKFVKYSQMNQVPFPYSNLAFNWDHVQCGTFTFDSSTKYFVLTDTVYGHKGNQ